MRYRAEISYCVVLSIVLSLRVAEAGSRPSNHVRLLAATPHSSSPRVFWPNNIRTYLNNNGTVFDAASQYSEGLFWPGNTDNPLVSTSGLWVSGRDEHGAFRTALNAYFSFYQPGRINGMFADTNYSIADTAHDPRFDIAMVWDTSSTSDPDYQRWIDDAQVTGAPLDGQGKPLRLGRLNAYWLMNDLDTTWMRDQLSHDPRPLGLETSNYVFAFDDGGTLSNTVFLIMDIKNKSVHTYDSTYLGWWNDIDVGFAMTNWPGCDSLLSLAYMYCSRDSDIYYSRTPPACGFVLLKTPSVQSVGRAMTSFMKEDAQTASGWQFPFDWQTIYNHANDTQYAFLLRGRFIDGRPLTPPGDPGDIITFADPGDPFAGTGWLASDDGFPFDFRELQGSGPFVLAPGQSIRFALAFVVAQDTGRLSSIRKLKEAVPEVMAKWNTLTAVKVGAPTGAMPKAYRLDQNYPNPFNPSTTIFYQLPVDSKVTMIVYDILGREVHRLVDEPKEAGYHSVRFEASQNASGAYLCRMVAEPVSGGKGYTAVKKLMVLK